MRQIRKKTGARSRPTGFGIKAKKFSPRQNSNPQLTTAHLLRTGALDRSAIQARTSDMLSRITACKIEKSFRGQIRKLVLLLTCFLIRPCKLRRSILPLVSSHFAPGVRIFTLCPLCFSRSEFGRKWEQRCPGLVSRGKILF